jgi:hypothetical protein
MEKKASKILISRIKNNFDRDQRKKHSINIKLLNIKNEQTHHESLKRFLSRKKNKNPATRTHVLLLTETQQHEQSLTGKLANYIRMYSYDSRSTLKTGMGGVSIWVHESIAGRCSEIELPENLENDNILWMKITSSSGVSLIGVVYNRPGKITEHKRNMKQITQTLVWSRKNLKHNHCIIGGDFNTRLGKKKWRH